MAKFTKKCEDFVRGEAPCDDEETPCGTTTLGSWEGMVIYHHPWRLDGDDDSADDGGGAVKNCHPWR